MRDLIKDFKVLSDESRLRVLNLILARECCVCEVMQSLGISQSKASRALTALYDVGFLKLRKQGLWSLYSIDIEEMAEYQANLLDVIKKVLEKNKIAIVDQERLKSARRTGVSCTQCKAEEVVIGGKKND
jgi:ArsR family transcriptional regulator, arsenate/arsenite/antimonite-responsive transcriptional repressor